MQNVVFKFRRPSGSDPQQPSRALTEALHRLGEAEEMQSLLAQGRQSGKGGSLKGLHALTRNVSGRPL